MKTKVLILFAVLFSAIAFSQVYVSPNNFIYVKDRGVFVSGNIDLQNGAEIFLRDESQLLQGTTTNSTNQGTGVLSVYQEGTEGAYEYNYWSSPVGNPSAAVGNENFGISLLNDPDRNPADFDADTDFTPATILAQGNYNGQADPLSISSDWIYTYNNGTSYNDWDYVGGTNNITPGLGFTMKGTEGTSPNNSGKNQRYDFRGKANDGNIVVNLLAGNSTLTGNPYPSALDMAEFLLDASNTAASGGAAFYWEQADRDSHFLAEYEGGYGTWVPGSTALLPTIDLGTYTQATFATYNNDGTENVAGVGSGNAYQRRFAPIGQGFMLEASATGSVTLKNIHRAYYKESLPYSDFQRTSSETESRHLLMNHNGTFDLTDVAVLAVPTIKIHMNINNTYTRELALAFREGKHLGFDYGSDGKMIEPLATDGYFLIDDQQFVIQSTNYSVTDKVSIGIAANNEASFKIKVGSMENFTEGQTVYLYDALNNSYTDILNDSFEISLPAGLVNDRFSITLSNETSLAVDDTILDEQLTVFQNNGSSELIIKNPTNLEIKELKIFNNIGQVVYTGKGNSDSLFRISTRKLTTGVYIAYVTSKENLTLAEKIIIE